MISLNQLFSDLHLDDNLLSQTDYRPFPFIGQRNEWDELPASIRQSVISEGEKYIDFNWPALTASMYMEFLQNGNRTRFDDPYHQRRRAVTSLVLAECVENKGRFLKDLIDGIWLISEESNWVISAHNRMTQERYPDLPDISTQPGIDLFAAETGNMFAWVHYLLRPALDQINPLISERIRLEVRRRILEPYLERVDCWWMGIREEDHKLNNWTPWCTSNCLSAVLLIEEDTERRQQAVRKALSSLDRYLAKLPSDGGCDEGPGYWNKAGASLFDCLELLFEASNGKFNLYTEPLIRKIGQYIYKAYIHERYFLNFADGPHRILVEADLVYRYGTRIADDNMIALGIAANRMFGSEGWKNMKFLSFLRVLPALFNYQRIENDQKPLTFHKEMWMENIQVLSARETSASDQGLYLAMKGGHNEESHNHNDVGHFVIYADGAPVFIDVGVEEYTAKTFSAQRYEIWTMQSAYHSLPMINGCMQQDGSKFRAKYPNYEASEERTQLTLEIAGAYPVEAGILSWQRSCRLLRSPLSVVELEERYMFANDEARQFTLNFMTCCEPVIAVGGRIDLRRNGDISLKMDYDSAQFDVEVETILLEDMKLRNAWGECLYRIILQAKASKRSGGIRFVLGSLSRCNGLIRIFKFKQTRF
ncbi:heparinase II/III domain-containing protein [Paenibacillus tyrfis]|uniref:heparinase II/III domain-containing protein n=1 Tax=Paenibacillus tyrfis TaxID=1501230 RepID=UPI00209F6A64|nr:heparinase II/III family protein [Paenibacillus tyrfis]MCP1308058.1 heparinase II/III-family protein [Paenibacillus tyrfis]